MTISWKECAFNHLLWLGERKRPKKACNKKGKGFKVIGSSRFLQEIYFSGLLSQTFCNTIFSRSVDVKILHNNLFALQTLKLEMNLAKTTNFMLGLVYEEY